MTEFYSEAQTHKTGGEGGKEDNMKNKFGEVCPNYLCFTSG